MNHHSPYPSVEVVDPYSQAFPSTPDHRSTINELRSNTVKQLSLAKMFDDSRHVWFACKSIPDDGSVAAAIAHRPDAEPLILRWRRIFWDTFQASDFLNFEGELTSVDSHIARLDLRAENAARYGEYGLYSKFAVERDLILSSPRSRALHIIDDAHAFLAAIEGPVGDTYILIGKNWYRFDGLRPDGGVNFRRIDQSEKKDFPEIGRMHSRRNLVEEYWAIGPYMQASGRLHFLANDGPTAASIILAMARHGHQKAFVKGQASKTGTWVVDIAGIATESEALARLAAAMHPSPYCNNAMAHPVVVQEFLPFTHEQRFFVQNGRIIGSACSDRNMCVLDATGHRLDERVAVLQQPAEHPGAFDRGVTTSVVDRGMSAEFVRVGRRFVSQMRANGFYEYSFDVGMTDRGPFVIETNDGLMAGPYCLDRRLQLRSAAFQRSLAERTSQVSLQVSLPASKEQEAPVELRPLTAGDVSVIFAGVDMSKGGAFSPELYQEEVLRPDPASKDLRLLCGELHPLVQIPISTTSSRCDAFIAVCFDARAERLVGVRSEVRDAKGAIRHHPTRYTRMDFCGLGALYLSSAPTLFEDGFDGLIQLAVRHGWVHVDVLDPDGTLISSYRVDWLPEAVAGLFKQHVEQMESIDLVHLRLMFESLDMPALALVSGEDAEAFKRRLISEANAWDNGRFEPAEQTAFGAAAMVLFALARSRLPGVPSTITIRRNSSDVMTLVAGEDGVIVSADVRCAGGPAMWELISNATPARAVLSGILAAWGMPIHLATSPIARGLVGLGELIECGHVDATVSEIASLLPPAVMHAAHAAATLLFEDASPARRSELRSIWHVALASRGWSIEGDGQQVPPLFAAMHANAVEVARDLLSHGADSTRMHEGRNIMDVMVESFVAMELLEQRVQSNICMELLLAADVSLPRSLGDGSSPALRFINTAVDDPHRLLLEFDRDDAPRPAIHSMVDLLIRRCGLERGESCDLAVERLDRVVAMLGGDVHRRRLAGEPYDGQNKMMLELRGVSRALPT